MKKSVSLLVLLSVFFLPPVALAQPAINASNTQTLNDTNTDGVANQGEQIDYTTTITNAGPGSANNVLYENTLDSNLTLVPGSVNVSPLAFDDNYSNIGGTPLNINAATGVLNNDNPLDGDVITVTAFDATSTQGGTVNVNADGSFTYNSALSFSGVDTFTYTAEDPAGLADTATVTINVSSTVWFIDNSAAPGGNGTLTAPFDSIVAYEAAAVDAPGDAIFFFEGAGTYADGFTLKDNQQLLGEGVGLAPVIPVGLNPVINNPAGTTLELAEDNTVRGLTIGAATGAAINRIGTLGVTTISDITVSASGTADGIYLGNTTGSFTLSDSTVNHTGLEDALQIDNGAPTVLLIDTTVSSATGSVLDILNVTGGSFTASGTSTLTATNIDPFDEGISVDPSGNPFNINISSANLSSANGFSIGAVFSDIPAGSSVNIDSLTIVGPNIPVPSFALFIASSAATFTFPSVDLTNAGSTIGVSGGAADVTFSGSLTQNGPGDVVRVDAGHTGMLTQQAGTISATSGTGLFFTNADGVYDFQSTVTLNGGDAGIDILSGSEGTFTFSNTTTITNPTGTAVNIDSSTADVTYNGTVTQNNAASALVVNNNTGGTKIFNGLITANTSTANGIDLTNNTGSTISLNGGFNIDTTTGTGLNATGGGTITNSNVSDIDVSSTGRALNLDGITVNPLIFSSVNRSAASANPAIDLNDVSGAGNLLISSANIVGSGVEITGTLSTLLNTTDLDIALTAAGQVGYDVNGAVINANVFADDFDLTSDDNTTTGIDLSGTTGSGTLQIGHNVVGGNDASIAGTLGNPAGPGVGVQFDNTTNVNFVFGDGENATDMGSSITAVTTISANPAPTMGSYDFDDVNLTGTLDFPLLGATPVFVAATPTGDGSGSDVSNRANSGTADAITTANTVFVLINDGSPINHGGIFTLSADQSINGFGNGNSITFDFNIPGSFSGISGGTMMVSDPTGNGAATLDTGTGSLSLSTDNTLANVVLEGGDLFSDTVRSNSGSNITFGSAEGPLVVNGGTASNAISLASIAGNIEFFDVQVNGADTGVQVSGSSGSIDVDRLILDSQNYGGIVLLGSNGTLNFADEVTDILQMTNSPRGIQVSSLGGTANFGAGTTITGGSSASFLNDSSTTNINYSGSIIQALSAPALNVTNSTGTITFNTSSNINVTNGSGLEFDNADGVYNFNGTTTLNGGDAGIDILNGSDGTFTFAITTSITNPSGVAVNVGGGTPNFTYNGTVTQNNAASAVEISGMSGGMTNFSGLITANTSTAIGISIFGNTAGTRAFSNLDIDTTTGIGFRSVGGGTSNVITGTVATTAGQAVEINGHATNINFNSIDSIGSTQHGVELANLTAGSVFNGGTTNISAATTHGIDIQNIGTGSDIDFGTTTINNRGNRGLNILSGAAIGGTIDFGATTVNNQLSNGGVGATLNNNSGTINFLSFTNDHNNAAGTRPIALTGNTGTINFGGGSLTNFQLEAIVVNGGSANISYDGTITSNALNETIEIFGGASGMLDLNGLVTANNSTANAVILNNSNATLRFDGGLDADTTSGTGIDILGGGNPVIHFGGTSNINATSGNAFNATGGGSVAVTGDANLAVNAAGGQALNINGTNIAAAGVTFRSIAATTGAANGIVLNNTGALGGLTVTGDGVTGGTGGFITGTTGDGISLTNANDTSLSLMALGTNTDQGIHITGGSGFTLDRSSIGNPTNELLFIDGTTGTITLTNNIFQKAAGNFADGIVLIAAPGLTNFILTGGSITGGASSLNYGIEILADGAGETVVSTISNLLISQSATTAMIALAENDSQINANISNLTVEFSVSGVYLFSRTGALILSRIANSNINNVIASRAVWAESLGVGGSGRADLHLTLDNNNFAATTGAIPESVFVRAIGGGDLCFSPMNTTSTGGPGFAGWRVENNNTMGGTFRFNAATGPLSTALTSNGNNSNATDIEVNMLYAPGACTLP